MSRYLLIAILSTAILVTTVVSDDAEEEEKKAAKKIGDEICKDEDRASAWLNCITCCQGLNPYALKKKTECNAEARGSLYGDKKLTKSTKGKMCGGMKDYAEELKKKVLDLKGDIKDCCATKSGLQDFFEKKIDCFEGCSDDPNKTMKDNGC